MARRYLGIIPARGGSKRLPGKNLQPLAGKPLLAHAVAAARRSRRLTAVVVSTDSEEIARWAAACGADPQGLRPAHLSRDDSPVAGALKDALARFERAHAPVDAVVLLQPTSPFRNARHIDEAIAAFESRRADTVTSVRLATEHPWWAWRKVGAEIRPYHSMRKASTDRSLLPAVYVENGAVYVIARALVMRGAVYGRRVVPYVMDVHSSLDVDTAEDLEWARYLLRQGGRGGKREGPDDFPEGARFPPSFKGGRGGKREGPDDFPEGARFPPSKRKGRRRR